MTADHIQKSKGAIAISVKEILSCLIFIPTRCLWLMVLWEDFLIF